MAHQVVWARCNVFTEDGDKRTVYTRGELLPDGVDAEQLSTLLTIGAVRMVDVVDDVPTAPAPAEEIPVPDELVKPSADAVKAEWVAFATDARNPDRITPEQATAMSKAALMEKYKDAA